MTPPNPFTSDHGDGEAVHRRAAEWLAQRDAGLTPAQAAELARWRAADPAHDAAYRRAEAAQHLLARLPEAPGAAAMLAELSRLPPVGRARRLPLRWPAFAVLAAAACVALAVWLRLPSRDFSHATFATAADQHRSIELPDGSTLVLNGGSAVEVAFQPAERRVDLREGEAHFYVARDAARPFLVGAGLVTVRAVGTAFNVRRSAQAVEVLVTEGKVQVSRGTTDAGASPSGDPLLLVAGQRAVIDGTSTAHFVRNTAPSASTDAADAAAWHAPRLVFRSTPLAEVVARFNAYNRVQIAIADPELAERSVGGTFDGDNADAFINLLTAGGDIRVERISSTRVVLHRAP